MKSFSFSIMVCLVFAAACGGQDMIGAGPAGAGGQGGGGASDGGASDGGGGQAGGGGEGGVAPIVCNGPGARFVTEVVSVTYGPGQDFGQEDMPDIVYGPPLGAGQSQGSLDVVSLGNGGEIVVAFADNAVRDGEGVDFIVFENAFVAGSGVFAELATVAVSADGSRWHEFPCTAVDAPYGSCAGTQPVNLDGDLGPIDPATSGGDPYDLADLAAPELAETGARYVRITDRADLDSGLSGVFDLDAVGIVHGVCE